MPASNLWADPDPLILASRSAARISLLAAAGIPLEAMAADIDERALEEEAQAGGADPGETALALARGKAGAVARLRPGRMVLGGDQTLACGAEPFHKPVDREEAAEQLRRLSGRRHELYSAAVVMRDEAVLFQTVTSASLAMRALSEDMIARYLDAAGESPLASVGAYQLEGLGIHLFEAIEGDHFTILGLPLIQLLAFFRQSGAVPQ
ncbi:Maf-like protein [Alsobacter metallidurans]|uniref:Nucleoside triphosphate pyrophosphatase n=1 Tax=Alsobacter metallidurans TaxID=340221 RepID=A0A917IDN0_9HYPH|nr:Maf family nucleotide pyrophosphatase [Alsobacter metallidurans]GGH33663.1 Maf-like protein [Alsobacter metallidurans]